MNAASTVRELLVRAQRLAVRQTWDEADGLLNQAILHEPQEASIELVCNALQSLASDCEKLGLEEVMIWAYTWLVRIQPAQVNPYLRLAGHHERMGERQTAIEWLHRGLEAAQHNANAEAQLKRAIRRIERSR